ncbi:MAG: selenocysteine-specific translation elongation factor [Anaerolineae bacterium]|nr:selenocysteine-specific translation elongation factor [Gemmatimonadaceae bacterium]
MILGTAGHVDHGKTALVKALTGVDTDRLAEEKRRGITIDLGFAPLRLAVDLLLGVVDVPGHEAFVRNMLAGATGIDLALLVVAADEGVMPQTREHLAIISLLGIREAVVALTKADLVEPDWLDLVREDVRTALRGSLISEASMVATSVVTLAGLDELRDRLSEAARRLPARDPGDLFRMPVDRSFTIKGTGTVVTGTVWSGALERDSLATLFPGGRTVRVRRIESHGESVEAAGPGLRAAIALAGVEVHEVRRGAVLVGTNGWSETRSLVGDVGLLDSAARAVGARTNLRFHLGTSDVGARVSVVGGTLAPGQSGKAKVTLSEPVVARAGDRFILRSGSPLETVGGGVVWDPLPQHRRTRLRSDSLAASPRERLSSALADASHHGVAISALPVRIGVTPVELAVLLANLPESAVRIEDDVYDSSVFQSLIAKLIAAVDAYHSRNPLEPGVSLQFVRSQLRVKASLAEAAVRRAASDGMLEISEALLRRRGWRIELTASQLEIRNQLLSALEHAGREPPDLGSLESGMGRECVPMARYLEREGLIIQVEENRFYARNVVEDMIRALREGMQPKREYSPPELREFLGLSRKFLIPFLEYCDRSSITERRVGGRVLRG